MTISRTPDLYVLDALANDVEDLESVLRMLNSNTALGWTKEWGRSFNRGEIVEALSRLVAKNLVQVLTLADDGCSLQSLPAATPPPSVYDEVYFALTERGRLVHRNWEPLP